ncbi:MAG: dihydrolipoyllysine-residue succinyltransferase [Verrucomicrobiota bacterium]
MAEITIPPFGESIVTANVSRWHKGNGDEVKKGETVVTLETDKVSQELEAPADGVLEILVAEDEEVEIGALIGKVAEGEVSAAPAESAPVPAVSNGGGSGPTGEVVEVKIPPFGESIATASVAAWSVDAGAQVAKGQILVSLETDKVSQELESPADGVIEILVPEGEEVAIGTVLAKIAVGATGGTVAKAPEPATSAPSAAPAPAAVVSPSPAAEVERVKPDLTVVSAPAEKVAAPAVDESGRTTRKKMSMLRRKIAQHLVNAQQTAAILTTFNEVDMTSVMGLRKQVQEDFVAKHGVKLGFMSIFVKAVVNALKEVPQIKNFIEGNEMVENHFFDIGVAVGTEKGLVVPVIRDCDQKSFAQIEKDIISAATRAKEGTLGLEELQGGIFTISNGGVYGSLLSTPILNPPQSGILGMHTIQQRPIAVDGKVEIRPMMYLALSYDHRIVDGKEGVTFLIKVKEGIENPTRLMLEV